MEEGDEILNCLNSQTEFKTVAWGDPNLVLVKQGEIIQLERKGYYICDKASTDLDPKIHLILIPDGKAESVALKGVPGNLTSPKIKKENISTKRPGMYDVESIYNDASPQMDLKSGDMYEIPSIYPRLNTTSKPIPVETPYVLNVPKAPLTKPTKPIESNGKMN